MQFDLVLEAATRARVPVLMWGPPGVGKSASILDWARRRSLRCWTVIASLREPSDFGGLPIVAPSSSSCSGAANSDAPFTVRFAPPNFAVEASREGGVIFLDELTTAPPAVQAALLRAVIDKTFGDLEMDPARVTIVAAANPPSQAAGGWDLAPPLANRFTHQEYVLSVESWAESFPGYWECPPVLSFGKEVVHEAVWGHWRALVAAFVRSRPTLLLQVPDDTSRRGQSWPSPRTWDYASRLCASAEQDGAPLADALPLLGGCVGEGVALEFVHWVRELDLPDPEELLSRPSSYRHPKRRDQAYAVLAAVCRATVQRLTPERWSAAWQVLSKAADAGSADVAASAARTLARQIRPNLPLPVREIAPFLPILQTAGLLATPDATN